MTAFVATSLILAGTHIGDAFALTKAKFESPNNQFGKKTSNKVCGADLCKPGTNNVEIPELKTQLGPKISLKK